MSMAASEPCVLHVAALPFPSYQGTQAAIRSMLEASQRMGQRAELLCYATSGYAYHPSFSVHRTADFPRMRSLRSGPSLGKVLLDARMLWDLRRVIEQRRPSAIVAHHVEAAVLALSLHRVPSVFFAHTDLAAELPSYAPWPLHAGSRWAGALLDRQLAYRADALATISPGLLRNWPSLQAGQTQARFVPTPWPLPAPIDEHERLASRQTFGFGAHDCVALYAGNLDAYQAPDSLLDALALARRAGARVNLLLATESDARSFIAYATQLGIPFRTSSLAGESVRRRVHAAADFAIVPRATPGGLPIKLLDALARGLACAISPHAAAGFDLSEVTANAREQGPAALADAVLRLARDAPLRARLAALGRAHIAREHSDERFMLALDAMLVSARRAFGGE